MNLLDEFQERISVLKNVTYDEATGRLVGILQWLEEEPVTQQILVELEQSANATEILARSDKDIRKRVHANTPLEIASVGHRLIEICRDSNKAFFGLCMEFGISPPYNSSRGQDYSDAGIRGYVVPFLAHVEKGLIRASETHSVAAIADSRFAELLTVEVRRLFPKTASSLERISGGFLHSEGDVMWQNVGNSCRQTLIEFAAEIREICVIEQPTDIKEADVKAILKLVLGKTCSPGRFKDTLEALLESVWNHTQTVLHRPGTSKKDAMRIYLWTGMLVGEFTQVIRAYNES